MASIALMPEILYYYGTWPEQRVKTVAIVGSRKNSGYGRAVAYELAKALGERGIVVVSGLAYGIDSIAARGALDGGGKTIAFLGTEIERIYPVGNQGLAEEIVARGGVVASEYKRGGPVAWPKVSFLQRNRLIAGVADVVVVVEAGERSGSLNTAGHALTQGKELFAVPGDINKDLSRGCNRLIFNGANPYLGLEDFLECLQPEDKSKRKHISTEEQLSLFARTEEERQVLSLILRGIKDGEEIMAQLEMSAVMFNQAIMMLEIKGAVRALGCNQWEGKQRDRRDLSKSTNASGGRLEKHEHPWACARAAEVDLRRQNDCRHT